ncbi:periplasmic heavy metal sensor [Tropicibacter oceani]|uniref:Periplasmic heavy metal sensor n=1 Tax=Tropicibacter oceani TaxID=3058420 RepID=A0ABY8QNA0_9RHOB|nr:periplasmic heavy metal sensor [Tropicibacter oceani]WGW05597.1 periplasmic heavy metal sensor [Tropicibacter oceani]
MADKDSPTPPRMRPWLRVLLFASLALNLAIAGMAAGVVLRGGSPHDRHESRDFVTPYTRAFDERQRDDLRRALRDGYLTRKDKDGARDDLTLDYRAALDVLRSEPFDAAAMAAILERQGARTADRQAMGQQVLSTYLAALSPQEREAYAQRLAQEITRLEARRERWKRDSSR